METVIRCEKVRDWMAKDGKLVAIYGIGFSDGQGGESFGKEIPIGTPLSECVIEDNGTYAKKVKWNKPGATGGFQKGQQRGGNESFALAYAKDMAVAYIAIGKTIEPEKVATWADVFYNWMETKKK